MIAILTLSSPTKASFADPLPECLDVPTTLLCRVSNDLAITTEEFLEKVSEATTLRPYALKPFYLTPRYFAASGDLARAIEIVQDYRDQYPTQTVSSSVFDVDPVKEVRLYSINIATDPLPILDSINVPQAIQLAEQDADEWARIAAARSLATSDAIDQAREAFIMASDISQYPNMSLLVPWAASGFADDALRYAAELSPIAESWSKLYLAEGLAMRGDIEGTRALVTELLGDMPMLGQPAIAEAYRRAGQPETALALLDETARAIETMSPGLREASFYRRIAIGYALLNDVEMTRYMMLRATYGTSFDRFSWQKVAPFIACHDLTIAIDLSGGSDALPRDVTELLIVASRSGLAEDAYLIAKSQENLVDRTLYLMAVTIGIIQAENVPPSDTPCSTLSIASVY
ncbi:MAG: hypothetical protein AAF563_20885 [Pseudomonadota bacterium]